MSYCVECGSENDLLESPLHLEALMIPAKVKYCGSCMRAYDTKTSEPLDVFNTGATYYDRNFIGLNEDGENATARLVKDRRELTLLTVQ